MQRIVVCISTLGLIAAIATGVCGAAQAREVKPSSGTETVTHPVDAASLVPFSLDATAPGGAEGVEFRSAGAITPQDRQAISKAWAAMAKKAAENGFDLDPRGWTYEEIVSPAFSRHVLLLFLHDGSSGERSEFSAIVPRKDTEPLYVIPILRRGYSPYSPAEGNPLTMAAFNQALASERAHEKPYWLWISACYAALSGTQVILPSAKTNEGEDDAAGWATTPSLHAEDDGSAVARFAVEGTPGRFAAWELTFDRNGNVVRVVVSQVTAPKLKVVRVVQ